ncbi:MAG: redoxin domain-containing protein, partial [Chloroflexi bacterium]|nr:redoxin domain-containing protein [Chloroflexota bacterium]
KVGNLAPEFEGNASWINSEPLVMSDLRGKVVLVDFWTYTCVNCIRTFPYLVDWNAKYADKGLVIVGVHTPEFEFEKDRENVIRATEEHGIEYPVAQDNEFETWRNYENNAWPAKYLTDANGVVRYTHLGEGAYDEAEAEIRKLLIEAGADLSGIEAGTDPGPEFDSRAYGSGDLNTRITRELYGGTLRNFTINGQYVADPAYYAATDAVTTYIDNFDHKNHFFYLQGPWLNGTESVIHARRTETFEDFVALKFYAASVNAVINPYQTTEPFEVEVTMDGNSLKANEAGADVIVEGGRSYFVVDEPRMYQVVELPDFGGHELDLSAKSEGFALFAFTFGAYAEGP